MCLHWMGNNGHNFYCVRNRTPRSWPSRLRDGPTQIRVPPIAARMRRNFCNRSFHFPTCQWGLLVLGKALATQLAFSFVMPFVAVPIQMIVDDRNVHIRYLFHTSRIPLSDIESLLLGQNQIFVRRKDSKRYRGIPVGEDFVDAYFSVLTAWDAIRE